MMGLEGGQMMGWRVRHRLEKVFYGATMGTFIYRVYDFLEIFTCSR